MSKKMRPEWGLNPRLSGIHLLYDLRMSIQQIIYLGAFPITVLTDTVAHIITAECSNQLSYQVNVLTKESNSSEPESNQ